MGILPSQQTKVNNCLTRKPEKKFLARICSVANTQKSFLKESTAQMGAKKVYSENLQRR